MYVTRNTIILGTGELARKLAIELATHRHRRYRLVGIVGERRRTLGAGWPCPYLGEVSGLTKIVVNHAIGRIVVALRDAHEELPLDSLIETRTRRSIAIEAGSKTLENLTGKIAIESLPESPLLFSGEFRHKPFGATLCRMISLLVSVPGFVVALPLMGAIALAIRLDSPGPILFVQDRVGRGGARFRFLKFRSMFHAAGKRSEWESDNLDKITRVGRILRKFRLDELPQFINVIAGDMNIVGPRPHPLTNRELFTLVARNMPGHGEQIPWYSFRQSIRPGITGWAQVRYKYANGLDEEIEKLQYDLYYVKHYTPWLDLLILFKTIMIVLHGHPEKPLFTHYTRPIRIQAAPGNVIVPDVHPLEVSANSDHENTGSYNGEVGHYQHMSRRGETAR